LLNESQCVTFGFVSPAATPFEPSFSAPSARVDATGAARAGAFDSIRAAARLADALLTAVERAAWAVRDAAAQARRDVGLGVTGARSEVREASQRLARLTSLSASLSRIVGSYRFHVTKAAFLTRAGAARSLEKLHRKNARRLREAAATHGGGVLKVAQMLSARPDVMPAAYVEELSVLQDAAPPVAFEAIRAVIERELGGALEHHFAALETEPLAAASIGQVHRATLHDGRVVALKVQRPGIEGLVAHDLVLLELSLEALLPLLPPVDHPTIARAIRTSLLRELDYSEEAGHAASTAEFLRDVEGLDVPEPVASHSTARVLSTRFVAGTKITTVLDALDARIFPAGANGAARGLTSEAGALTKEVADEEAASRRDRILGRVLEAWLRQILEAGRFQADPHPGNLLVTDDDVVVLLDFGCTQVLEPASRDAYLALVQATVFRDEEGMARALDTAGFRTRSGRHDTLKAFAQTLIGSFARAEGEARWPTADELAAEARALMSAATDDPVTHLPQDFVMLARVLGTIGGLFVRYRPRLDVAAHVLPIVLRAASMQAAQAAEAAE
jgi:ubiquinone biosynthesis protein